MRVYLLWLVVFFFCFYSYKDWFKSLCFLIFLMAILERPDMPKGVLGIPGFNPWNILLLNVCAGAFLQLSSQKPKVKLTSSARFFVPYYLFFIILSFIRGIIDLDGIYEFHEYMGSKPLSPQGFVMKWLFIPIRHAIPGLLVYYGCNSSQRLKLLMFSILMMNVLVALQIIKVMPLGYLSDGTALEQRAIFVIDRSIGYYRSDAAIFLAGAAWGIFAFQELFSSKFKRLVCMGLVAVVALGIALTGGRIGQGAFLLIGAVLAWYRWRRLFILAPVGLIVLVTAVPSVLDRFTQGFTYDPNDAHFESADSVEEGQMNSITSGRTVIWPEVIDKILESPFLGYGRQAMQRIGLSRKLGSEHGEPFPHPHNAYLQLFLDNGLILGLPVLLFYFSGWVKAYRMFKSGTDKLCVAASATCFSIISAFLIGAIAQQSFYPPASSVVILCAIGVIFRLDAEKNIFKSVKDFELGVSESWNKPPKELKRA